MPRTLEAPTTSKNPPPQAYPPGSAWNPPSFPGGTRLLARFGWLISPTPSVGLLAMVIFAMYYAAVSQANSVAYLIAFTIIGMTAVSLIHGFFMLRRLEFTAGPPSPIFSGEQLEQVIHLR